MSETDRLFKALKSKGFEPVKCSDVIITCGKMKMIVLNDRISYSVDGEEGIKGRSNVDHFMNSIV